MARDLNKVQLTGHLGAEPALRRTAHGSPLLIMRLATSRVWRSAAGVSHAETESFRVIAWGQLAEQWQGALRRGAHLYVEGRLQHREWVDAAGAARVVAEVVASELILLSERSAGEHIAAVGPPAAE